MEGVGRIEARRQDGDSTIITHSAPASILDWIVGRRPVCVDGISLTVIAKDERTFCSARFPSLKRGECRFQRK